MATIHRATDVRFEREVAVKILRPEVAKDPDLAHRFRREALAATVLRHPNIVACLDTGTDGIQAYLVMALVDGEDLAARLRRSGRLAPMQAARIGLDVARALGVAHVRGIVHRDVKPGNILLAADGRAMVTDFGIARLAADAEAALPGTTLGSVHYFSPEQARGTTTTPASDVYGLGLVLFEALTGTRAWTGATSDAIALARVGAPAPSARALRPEVPASLEAVVRRALAPDPGDRYPNGMAMAAALAPIVSGADASTTTVVPVPVPLDGEASERLGDGAAPPPPRRANRALTGGAPRAAPRTPRAPRRRPADERPLLTMPRAIRGGRSSAVLAMVGIVGVVAGALLVAALPGDGATTIPTPRPPASEAAVTLPTAAAEPTIAPTPEPTPPPTADPSEAPTPLPAGDVADLCEIFFDIPCGLGAGRYAPSRFSPAFDIELGDGWSASVHTADTVTLTRKEGEVTIAGKIVEVYPDGEARKPKERARDIIEALIATNGVSATRPANVSIDGRRGLSTDLTPIDPVRVQLFATDGTTFLLEPDRTTRIVVMDLRKATVLVAIEPHEGSELADILATADDAAGTMRWR
ncbi:MAG: eukaryotic-like serine/threonine-protein kinase [Chloroflexota bacterium]|jgi:serine/threonine-protein kinase|nr:eukaryotic-like serine/threonine-protein kinase [Chloroflexota bacterium]